MERQPPSIDALRLSLAQLPPSEYPGSRSGVGPLRGQVFDVADDLKAAGLRAEHVLLAVKTIALDSMMDPLGTLLIDQIVTWSIERYFESTDPTTWTGSRH
jgi:hypothetical protein